MTVTPGTQLSPRQGRFKPLTGAERRRRYYVAHRTLDKERSLEWRRKHLEEWRRYMRSYIAEHALAIAARQRVRRRARPDLHRGNNAAYRARKRGNGGSHTVAEWLAKCDLLGNVCFYCGESKPLTRDHNIPLVRGGSNDIGNILPACRSCNCGKRTRTALEYLELRRSRLVLDAPEPEAIERGVLVGPQDRVVQFNKP